MAIVIWSVGPGFREMMVTRNQFIVHNDENNSSIIFAPKNLFRSCLSTLTLLLICSDHYNREKWSLLTAYLLSTAPVVFLLLRPTFFWVLPRHMEQQQCCRNHPRPWVTCWKHGWHWQGSDRFYWLNVSKLGELNTSIGFFWIKFDVSLNDCWTLIPVLFGGGRT